MWVALFVMLALGGTYLKVAPPLPSRSRSDAEDSFWRSTNWQERKSLRSLVERLPGEATSFASLDLRHLVMTSRSDFVEPLAVRTASQGPRDLCLVDLPDGGTLRLTVFDHRNARRFAAAWSPDAELGIRLRYIEGLGWQCSLHNGVGNRAAVASVYGWLADIDRSHHSLVR